MPARRSSVVGHCPYGGQSKRAPRVKTLPRTVRTLVVLLLTAGLLAWLVGSSEKGTFMMPSFLRTDTDVWSKNLPHRHDPEWRSWLGQSGIHVAAIVFYGRHTLVRILDSYLKRNLVSAGGLLEEVVWIVRTDNQQDLDWLEHKLLPSEPVYYKKVVPTGAGYSSHYSSLVPDWFYVKIDDDIMYIEDSAIDDMLHEKLKNRFWMVSANVINHSVLTWVHAAMGAMQLREQAAGGLNLGKDVEQRMLPFLEAKPFQDIRYGAYESACALHSVECAALSHLNFLQNLADNNTACYNFGVWDFNAFNYARWSINAFMFRGSDLRNENLEEDELAISQVLPERKGKRSGAVGSALVVHLAYFTQRDAGLLDRVNLVEQYTALAAKLNGALLDDDDDDASKGFHLMLGTH